MPLIPPTSDSEQKQYGVATSNPMNKYIALTDALNRLTDIINVTPPSSNVSIGESSSSAITPSNQAAIVKHTYSLHEHIQFRFSQDRSQVIQVSIGNLKTVLK
jgi:hypothetical protein